MCLFLSGDTNATSLTREAATTSEMVTEFCAVRAAEAAEFAVPCGQICVENRGPRFVGRRTLELVGGPSPVVTPGKALAQRIEASNRQFCSKCAKRSPSLFLVPAHAGA